jgi:hypothetical protein
MLLSPLGERLGEAVMQEAVFALTPSPNLSPKGERNMKHEVEVRGSLLGARHSVALFVDDKHERH